jgi:uncharacterized SAM-binding protein YcdF (DUF218 family)
MRMIESSRAKLLSLAAVFAWLPITAFMLFATSGTFLVTNRPQKSDLIVVLAGETENRPLRGLELLRQNYAPRMMIDVPAGAKIYDENVLDVARKYVSELPERESILLCPIFGLSTKAETRDVENCLREQSVHALLLVTSDFHTRRAEMIFRRELVGYKIFVAASSNSREFGTPWWEHRQWAKTNLGEWLRLVWWELVERWTA